MGKRARHNKMCLTGKRRNKGQKRSLARLNATKFAEVPAGSELNRTLNNTGRRYVKRDESKRLLRENIPRRTKVRTKVYKDFDKVSYIWR